MADCHFGVEGYSEALVPSYSRAHLSFPVTCVCIPKTRSRVKETGQWEFSTKAGPGPLLLPSELGRLLLLYLSLFLDLC